MARWPFLFLILVFAVPVFAQEWQAVESAPLEQKSNFTIAVVRDGDSPLLDSFIAQTKIELQQLVRDEFEVAFKQVPAFNAQWDFNRMKRVFLNALNDPEVDMVYAVGVLVTQEIVRPEMELTKPVVAGLILDADLFGMPYDAKKKVSTKSNFSFVASPKRVSSDLATFTAMVPGKEITIVGDRNILQGLEGTIEATLKKMPALSSITIKWAPVLKEASEFLPYIENNVEAVYLVPIAQMSSVERQKLIEGINAQKIPSFTFNGFNEVHLGVLAGQTKDFSKRLARRIALNMQQLMLGVSPNDLPVYLSMEPQLVINAKTLKAIGYAPDFKILNEAEVLFPEVFDQGEYLTLNSTINLARKQNIDLAVARADVEIAKENKNQAFSPLLPQIKSNVKTQVIDKDRAQAFQGGQPESLITAGVTASQLLFDDAVLSRFRSAVRSYQGEEFEREAVRLDVIDTASKRFLQYLSSKALSRVEEDNLKLTQRNLELATFREQAGTAGPEEVYRWEAQEANQKASLYQSQSAVEQARVALNQSLNVDQYKRWDAKEIFLEDDDYYFLRGVLGKYLHNTYQLAIFRRFIVEEAFYNSPELRSIEKAIEAQTIILNQLKRKFVIPRASTFVSFDYELDRKDFAPAEAPTSDKEDWTFGVNVVYPLFEGGGRHADVYRAEAELDQLNQTYERAKQLIAQRTQSALFGLEGSHPNIALSRLAASKAQRNLDVVQEKYKEGTLPIIDLLDAQSQAFTQNQSASVATYDYLQNLMEFQRATSWFQETKTAQEKTEWVQRFQEYMEKMKDEGKNWI